MGDVGSEVGQRGQEPFNEVKDPANRLSRALNPTFCVRRGKVSILSGCNSRPATLVVPAGSNRSGGGGNETVGAFDGKGRWLMSPNRCLALPSHVPVWSSDDPVY